MKKILAKISWFFSKLFGRRQYTSVDQEIRRKTIISLSVFTVLLFSGYKAWMWLLEQPEDADGVERHLRKGFEANEKVFGKIFSNQHMVKTFPKSEAAEKVRVNGDVGLGEGFDYKNWVLNIQKVSGDILTVPLSDILALPKTEIIYDFKCVEGWSQVSHWAGVRFSDFVEKYNLHEEVKMGYVGMETPDAKYYVGVDMASMMHPQTLLCYEMNNDYLPLIQGYPLRLIIPVKYGIKNLKRIGNISFSNEKPRDYWAENGYDYYAGL